MIDNFHTVIRYKLVYDDSNCIEYSSISKPKDSIHEDLTAMKLRG